MNRYIRTLLLGLSVSVFISCEKVIDIKTDNKSGNIVIEGVLSNKAGQCVVLISSSKQLSDNNSVNTIEGAIVSINEEGLGSQTLYESSSGTYVSQSLKGTPGKKYTLTVQYDGKTYTSVCVMPQQIPIANIYTEKETFFGEDRILVQVEYLDPVGLGNCYRAIQYVNDLKEKELFLRSDEYSDGKVTRMQLRAYYDEDEDEKNVKIGDRVTIEFQCIAPQVHKFWESLGQGATGGGQSATPANPVSNIVGGALGYFSAHTYERVEFEVQ